MLSQCTLLKTDRFGRSLTLFVKADTCCAGEVVFGFTLQNPAGVYLSVLCVGSYMAQCLCFVFECMLLAELASALILMCLIMCSRSTRAAGVDQRGPHWQEPMDRWNPINSTAIRG